MSLCHSRVKPTRLRSYVILVPETGKRSTGKAIGAPWPRGGVVIGQEFILVLPPRERLCKLCFGEMSCFRHCEPRRGSHRKNTELWTAGHFLPTAQTRGLGVAAGDCVLGVDNPSFSLASRPLPLPTGGAGRLKWLVAKLC